MSSTHDPKRRAVLLGGLAAGCAACLPAAWAAEKMPAGGKQPAQQPSQQPGGGSSAGKMTQAAARYQSKPNANQKCSNCANFIAPGSCKVVDGKVSPNGWCIVYAPKSA